MLFENVFQFADGHLVASSGCDLMLFENVFQFCHARNKNIARCDLMLFENVFQSYDMFEKGLVVVI